MTTLSVTHVGVVAIGRNEGARLIRCLKSLQANLPSNVAIIYVDSDSTDNSIDEAKNKGVEVVQLDMSVPFTAARARNAGSERLMAIAPQRSEEHTSELQSLTNLVCRLLLEKKKKK